MLEQLQRQIDKQDSWLSAVAPELLPWLAAACWVLGAGTVSLALAWWFTKRAVTAAQARRTEHNLASAVLAHARVLSDKGSDKALLKLREQCDYLLHTKGANKARQQLGALALQAATRQQDRVTQIEIMLDDLGWTHHLAGEPQRGLPFIDHAIDEAKREYGSTADVKFALLAAKGLRHRAIILSKTEDIEKLDRILAEAAALLDSVPDGNRRDVELAHAQLEHAKALGRLSHRGLDQTGIVSPGDKQSRHIIEEALTFVRSARQRFSQQKSDYRVAKALVLEERALRALGKDAEATVLAAERNRMTTQTDWELSAENRSILGA